MKKGKKIGFILALCSGFLSAFNVIIEKKYISYISSDMILFLMYLGAGIGLFVVHFCTRKKVQSDKNRITKKEIPKVLLIVFCELLASFFIIESVKVLSASLVSLLLVFELIMTSLISYVIFKNPLSKKEIISMILMALGFVILNLENGIFSGISIASLLVIAACICWGVENNITAIISSKEPSFFTAIKCSSVAILYLIIMLVRGTLSLGIPILVLFGFFTYGMGILTYAISTRYLGASKATIIFSFSPIFGVLLSLLFYRDVLSIHFIISLVIMIVGLFILNPKDEEKEV